MVYAYIIGGFLLAVFICIKLDDHTKMKNCPVPSMEPDDIKTCIKYRNHGAHNGGCLGVSLDWSSTWERCLKCDQFHENL